MGGCWGLGQIMSALGLACENRAHSDAELLLCV